jgi:hypothetical protein
MFVCVKRHKRLWIESIEKGKVYTPPNFIRLQSRQPMHDLAKRFTELGERCINAIADFEARHSARKVKQ